MSGSFFKCKGTVHPDLKIADFGLSAFVGIENDTGFDAEEGIGRKKFRKLKEMWGTKEYFAPELIDRAYGPQADLWSVGCIVYEILAGDVAFPIHKNEPDSSIFRRIQTAAVNYDGQVWKELSVEAKSFVQGILLYFMFFLKYIIVN